MAFYSDKHGIFRVNAKDAIGGDRITQFGRVLSELNIDIICANSPLPGEGLCFILRSIRLVNGSGDEMRGSLASRSRFGDYIAGGNFPECGDMAVGIMVLYQT